MEAWMIESKPGKQIALSAAVSVVGLILAYGFRQNVGQGMTDGFAGFLLGLLLLVIGAAGLVTISKQSVTVDPRTRRITIGDTNLFGRKERTITFGEIVDARVAEMGKRSSHTVTYYVSLKLRSGESYPLFFPAYYDGRWSRSVAESRCSRLAQYLRT